MFLWRALSDTLLVTTNLIMKMVEVDPSCPMCGLAHEDAMHCLVLYDFSNLVWHESALPIPSVVRDSLYMWFSSVLCDLLEEQTGFIVAVLYHLWRARNFAVWDGCLPLLRASGASSLHAWRAVHCYQESETVPTTAAENAPVQMVMTGARCYFDAGYRSATLKAPFGTVLISADGGFMAAMAGAHQAASLH